jgi:hypothetical protein
MKLSGHGSEKTEGRKDIVFFGGFPKQLTGSKFQTYLKSIAPTAKVEHQPGTFKPGVKPFAMIYFPTQEETDKFVSTIHQWEGKVLICKISQRRADFISDC